MLSSNLVCKIALLALICCGLLSCRGAGNNEIAEVEKPGNLSKPVKASPSIAKNKEVTKPKKQNTAPVKSFVFENPSPDWTASEPGKGDGALTKVKLKSNKSPVKLTVTSIGLPVASKEAGALVKECESSFAKGYAKHPELTREWIRSGFSISRYSDPNNGEISVWCVSETCKVRLNFEFGKSGNVQDNIKIADGATDDFFTKNPTGGAKDN